MPAHRLWTVVIAVLAFLAGLMLVVQSAHAAAGSARGEPQALPRQGNSSVFTKGQQVATCSVSPDPVTQDQTFTVSTSGLDPANEYVLRIAPPHGVYEFQTMLTADNGFSFTAISPWIVELAGLQPGDATATVNEKIGRASCRERV